MNVVEITVLRMIMTTTVVAVEIGLPPEVRLVMATAGLRGKSASLLGSSIALVYICLVDRTFATSSSGMNPRLGAMGVCVAERVLKAPVCRGQGFGGVIKHT